MSYDDREFVGESFSVSIVPVFREVVRVIHTRDGSSLPLDGEHISSSISVNQNAGIGVRIPQSVEPARLSQIVRDLQEALGGLGYVYLIDRISGIEIVPEDERNAAVAEMREMGYEIEILSDGSIRQTPLENMPRPDLETLKRQALRMGMLIQSIGGKRTQIEILARSEGF
jgi:hypothetical protein